MRGVARGILVGGLVCGLASLAQALHRESPGSIQVTSGVAHQTSRGRAWGNWVVFTSPEDLTGLGASRVPGEQVFVFNLAYYDCAQGTTFPATPCPPSGTPYLRQATNGPGNPANPSLAEASTSSPPFDVWIAFDALGTYGGNVGAAATRRQIFLRNLATNELRQATSAGDGDSVRPSLSSAAGLVAFESTAALLAGFPNPSGVSQVFVYERVTNVTRQLSLTVSPTSVSGSGASTNPMPNEVGMGVAFESRADLLGSGADTGIAQIFWADYDRTAHQATLRQLTDGNAPSRNPAVGISPKVVVFESEATDLPGTPGLPGRQIYRYGLTDPPALALTPLTLSTIMGDCGAPSLDGDGTRIAFVCTGDPLQNLTVGPRLFVFDLPSSDLYQLTGLGTVSGTPAANLGQWFVAVATSSDLTGSGSCTTQIHVLDYYDGKWRAATTLGQYPGDVAPTNSCGGNCTTHADCDDLDPCNGIETCGSATYCVRGAPVVCSDGNLCNGVESCNTATGTCVTSAPPVCNDGIACTTDLCDPTLGCVVRSNCPVCERCDTVTQACVVGPRTNCTSGPDVRAGVRVRKRAISTGDSLVWEWRQRQGAAASFGTPTTTDDYGLCVYDATGTLALRSDAPAGLGWSVKAGPSFLYDDPAGTPTGLVRLVLKSRPPVVTKMVAKARGAALGLPSPASLALPIRTQLQAESGACWEATFGPDEMRALDATRLTAKLP